MSGQPYAPLHHDGYSYADLSLPPPGGSAPDVPFYDESASISYQHDPYGDPTRSDALDDESKLHVPEEQALTSEKVDPPLDDPMYITYPPPRHVQYGLPDPNTLGIPSVSATALPSRPGSAVSDSLELGPQDSASQVMQSQVAWAGRQARPRRGLTRRVKLTKGHWTVEHRVPTAVLNSFEPKWTEGVATTEFSHMRYTAATCDPDDFTRENGWTLRASDLYGRDTEILIAITYYNEDRALVARTLHGVMENIRDICKSKTSKFWRRSGEEGRHGWQRIVVALIFDGIDPCDKEVLDLLATVGVYQDGVMKRKVDGKETVAHLFEYTTQLSVDATPSLVQPHGDDKGNMVPVQMIFCLKQKNSKKINSHRWLFNALGLHLQPEVCILIDAGTKPSPRSLYYLWEAMYNNRHLGGCCGEIHAMINGGLKLVNPLVAAQNFEYKMSNILDKPLESVFGYVSVLPGAFSAYRFRAVQGRPLQQYFHGDHTLAERLGKKGVQGMGIFTKNMFLAEDRILCFELVFKRGDRWTLGYVKQAKGETDVPEKAAELISQRRRWLNGSFAASIYAIIHFWKVYRSGHGILRTFFLHLQALYNSLVLFFTWFALANLWLTFSIIIEFLPDVIIGAGMHTLKEVFLWINKVCMWLYVFFLVLQFVLALGNRPKAEQPLYVLSFIVFGFMGVYLLVVSIWLTVKMLLGEDDKANQQHMSFWRMFIKDAQSTSVLVASLIATFGVYLVASIMYLDPWHMLTSFPQYMAIAPSLINILNVYAFCNLHDVSWGTKGSDKADVLPSVNTKKAAGPHGDGSIEEVEQEQEDIDAHFREVVQRAVAPVVVAEEVLDKPTMDDSNKTFRTRLVAAWILCNGALTVAIQNINGINFNAASNSDSTKGSDKDKTNYYFKFLLWSTFGLSFFKFCGFCVFWSTRLLAKPFRKT